MDIVNKLENFLGEAARKSRSQMTWSELIEASKKRDERERKRREREAQPLPMDKELTVALSYVTFMGSWGVPVVDYYVVTGRMEDVANYLGVPPGRTANSLVTAYNKAHKASNDRARADREQGVSGPPVEEAILIQKFGNHGSPTKTYEEKNCRIQFFEGKSPF